MKSSIGSPKKADIHRFQIMQEVGCLACVQLGLHGNPGDVHHLLHAGRRISHQHTVCLCAYHHRGLPPNNLTDREAHAKFGPSLAKDKHEFHERFGDDDFLLTLQNEALKIVEGNFV